VTEIILSGCASKPSTSSGGAFMRSMVTVFTTKSTPSRAVPGLNHGY